MQSDELQDKISVEHFSECMKITRREFILNPHVNFFPSSFVCHTFLCLPWRLPGRDGSPCCWHGEDEEVIKAVDEIALRELHSYF